MTPAEIADLILQIEEQERRLVLPHFTNEDAWRLGGILVRLAGERAAPVAVDIRRGAQQLFHCALPGSNADNDAWLRRKTRTVERFGHSSYLVGLRFAAQGSTFEAKSLLDPARYAAHGGAFPITVTGVGVVGAVAVSGLPQGDDHQLVATALSRYLAEPQPADRPEPADGAAS